VLGNLAIIAVVAYAVVLPASTFFSDRDERIADQNKVLARLRGIVAQETNIRAIASDTKAQLQSGEFLQGTNENVVNADLQTRLKALTEGAGTRSRSVQALPVKGPIKFAMSAPGSRLSARSNRSSARFTRLRAQSPTSSSPPPRSGMFQRSAGPA
jgi:hypothetical protein